MKIPIFFFSIWLLIGGCFFPTQGQAVTQCDLKNGRNFVKITGAGFYWFALTEIVKGDVRVVNQGVNGPFLKEATREGYTAREVSGEPIKVLFPGPKAYEAVMGKDKHIFIPELNMVLIKGTEVYHPNVEAGPPFEYYHISCGVAPPYFEIIQK